jgi:tetratricopeptide (TPR) repeat protein
MKIYFRLGKALSGRSGFRQKAGIFNFKKCGGRPTAATIAILIFTGNIFAADVTTDFSDANKLYAEGKFSDAANIYEKILLSGAASPNLLFNYGDAEFKSGNPGKAIAAFRRAGMLAPRDSAIRANLDFVRNQVQGSTLRESRWRDWLGRLTLNEWTALAAGAFWLSFILLAARQLRPALVPRLKNATWIFAALTIFSGACLGLQATTHFSKQSAIVISPEAIARSGPFDEAQNAFAAHDGAELLILDRHGDWLQVTDGSGKIGWLPTKQVEILPGA